MPSLVDTTGRNELSASLLQALKTVSFDQVVSFVLYRRVVLPLDGYVFWVKADVFSPSAIPDDLNTLDSFWPNEMPAVVTPARTLKAQGSFHYSSELRQAEDEGYANNRVVFTTQEEVKDLNAPEPGTMWIAKRDGLTFAFSRAKNFFEAAGTWHYEGDALNPALRTQILDDARTLVNLPVVSNSLPFWLSFGTRPNPIWLPARNLFPIYPSMAVPYNNDPPYAAVHIFPDGTKALQAVPEIDRLNSSFQLAQDRVRLTMVGLRSDAAIDLLNAILARISNYEEVGLMSSPTVRDEKRGAVEFGALAQKKTIEFEVSYHQTRMQNVARQLILHAFVTFTITDLPEGE